LLFLLPYAAPPTPTPQSICLSETFGAFYTQAYDDYVSPEHDLSGYVVSAFMGCKDRLTLGGMCSYSCYDGEYFERFVGVTTRIVTAPPQDWDSVDPWDHPVYCAWDLGHMAAKALPPPPQASVVGYNFSCDFTIKAICCDDIVPHVPYGGDVDLGDDGSCPDGGCDGGCGDDTGCGGGDGGGDGGGGGGDGGGDCGDAGCGKSTGDKKNSKKSSKKSSRTVRRASIFDAKPTGYTPIGNAKVTGGVRSPKHNAAAPMHTKAKVQPAQLSPASTQGVASNTLQAALKPTTASVKVPARLKPVSVAAAKTGQGEALAGAASAVAASEASESQSV